MFPQIPTLQEVVLKYGGKLPKCWGEVKPSYEWQRKLFRSETDDHNSPEGEGGEHMIINVWRPIKPVHQWGLAVLDGRSMKQGDVHPTTINKFDNSNSLSDLNNAFTNKSFKILVKNGYKLIKPLIIYHTTNSKIWSKNINFRLDFELDKDSSLRVIDIFNDTSEKNFLNIFYNFELRENAVLKNYKIDKFENRNIKYSFNNIEQDKNSVSETFILSSGSNFFKNEINCNLKGEYASAFVNGIFSLKNDKHHEIRTIINHLTENTKSYQLIKSVLEENSKAVYQGKIFVDSEAQKTDGYQLSKAILLNEESEFNAKPELEIYADDVKCSHGSASGSLNEDSIFYLMSRGLSYQQSRELLINGFLLDVVEKITDSEIKNLIKNLIGIKE